MLTQEGVGEVLQSMQTAYDAELVVAVQFYCLGDHCMQGMKNKPTCYGSSLGYHKNLWCRIIVHAGTWIERVTQPRSPP